MTTALPNTTKDIIAIAVLLIIVFGISFLQRRPRALNTKYFETKWQELQKLCANKATWPLALINADNLLDEALKKCHFKGKTMGERLVAAQRDLSNNDGVWFGHKLRNQIVHEAGFKLRKRDVQDALVGIRQALKDLKAL